MNKITHLIVLLLLGNMSLGPYPHCCAAEASLTQEKEEGNEKKDENEKEDEEKLETPNTSMGKKIRNLSIAVGVLTFTAWGISLGYKLVVHKDSFGQALNPLFGHKSRLVYRIREFLKLLCEKEKFLFIRVHEDEAATNKAQRKIVKKEKELVEKYGLGAYFIANKIDEILSEKLKKETAKAKKGKADPKEKELFLIADRIYKQVIESRRSFEGYLKKVKEKNIKFIPLQDKE